MERGWTLLVLGTLCLSAYMHTCTATTTTGPGCSFNVRLNTRNSGGDRRITFNTRVACETLCCLETLCVAYEWQKVALECWTYTVVSAYVDTPLNDYYGKVTATTTTTTTTTTTAPGCIDTFMPTLGSGRQNAVMVTGLFTLAECTAECLRQTRVMCAAFDWAGVTGAGAGQRACWIATEAIANANQITSRQSEVIDAYTRMACDAATTTPTSTPAVGQCTDTFPETQNANFLGGERQAGNINTVDLCRANCLSVATCTGFDFVTATGECWTHTRTTFDNGGTPSGVNHYRRVACNATVTGSTTCVDSFTEERGKQLFNGAGRANIDPLACLEACRAEVFCTHYEINSANQCFLHFNQSGETAVTIINQNHRLYTRQPCAPTSTQSGVCRDIFNPRANTNVPGGISQSGVTSVEACISACLEQSNPPCTAFDFSSFGTTRCYLFFAVNRQYSASTDVTHYERDFRCNGTVTGSGCIETYLSSPNSNRQGGRRQASINSNAGCSAGCSGQGTVADATACYGYDFNANSNECYFHIGSISTTTGVFQGVTSYVRGFVCSRSTTLGSGCRDVYTPSPNSNVFGGSGKPQANTETLCRTACSATIEGQAGYCYGYDFDSNSNACFFIVIPNYEISPGANGVTHYNRKRECPGTGTGTGCIEAYNSTANRNAAGGTDIGAQTVESCGTECAARNTTCYGFDLANGNCWLLLAEYTLNPGPANGVTNYRRLFNCGGGTTTASGCTPTYTLRPNIIVYGGVAGTGVTVESCAAACNAETNCVAYNYVKIATDQRCFLIRGSVGSENPNDDLDLYVQNNNCDSQTTVSVTQCRMELLGQGNVNGGTFVPSVETLPACINWCIGNEPCLAVDWDSNGNQCFWFTTTSTTASGSSCCQHFNKVCENTCTDSFNVTVGIGYFNGMEVQNRPNVMACQTACMERELCAGFDFNTEFGSCYTHVLSNFDRSFIAAAVSNYRRVRCPGGTAGRTTLPTTLRTTACPDRFVPIPNSNAQGGTPTNSGNTLPNCQRACTDNPLCTAFDYINSGCWIHTGTPDVRLNLAQGVTHYQRRRCQEITPSAVTPPPVTPAPGTPFPNVCNMDLFILVDAITPGLLDQMGVVIQQMITGLNVNNNNVRVSVRAFGNTNTRLFQFATNEEFIRASVANIRSEGGPNNLPSALQNFLGDEYRSTLSVGRQPFLVILSDLNVDNRYLGSLNSLRNQLISIPTSVVTFNNDLNRNVLGSFSPSINQIFHINGNDHITASNILSQVTPVCRSNRPLTPSRPVVTIVPPRQCLGDIVILMDDSGSIREEASMGRGGLDNWPIMLNFVRDILRSLDIGSQNTRVAIATFSNDASVIYRFDNEQNTNILQDRIRLENIQYTGGNTNLMAGLQLVRTEILLTSRGDRPQEPNVVILITDGRPTGSNNVMLEEEIRLLRSRAEIIPVGVTSSVDIGLLQSLTSNNRNVFNVDNFSGLNTILDQVVAASCNALRR